MRAARPFVLSLLLCVAPAAARAATVEIGPTDDAEVAINALQPGDELVLGGGTYTFTERFGVSVKGTAALPIVVRAKSGELPVFYRGDDAQNLVDLDDVEYFTFRGIELRGGSHGIRMIRARFVTIEECEIHDTADVAVSANSTGPYEGLTIRRNHIHDTGGTGEGMYLGCNSDACRIFDSLIEGNYIHHTNGASVTQGDGIEIKEGSYNNVVRDNVIHDTGYPCILTYSVVGNGGPNVLERNVMWGCGDHAIQSAADAVIRNNIILSAVGSGIAMQPHQAGTPSNLVVVHNTIVKASGTAISASGITGSVVIANNAVYAQSGTGISVAGTLGQVAVAGNVGVGGLAGVSAGLAAGDLASDFVAANWAGAPPIDLFPAAGSALIGAGSTTYVAVDDFAGRARNGVADVGAYAYAAGAPAWVIAAGFKDEAVSPPADGGVPTDGGGSPADGGTTNDGGGSPVGDGGVPPVGDGGGSPVGDGAATGTDGAGGGHGSSVGGGCGCAAGGRLSPGPALLAILGAALACGRRRRRRRRPRVVTPGLALVIVLALAGGGCGSSSGTGDGGLGDGAALADGGAGDATAAGDAGGDGPPRPLGATITRVTLTAAAATGDAVVTFGQAFARGDVPPGTGVAARGPDGGNVHLQLDAKATHDDGSLRHAVVTLVPGALAVGDTVIELVTSTPAPAAVPLDPAGLLATAFDVEVVATLGGVPYRAAARPLLAADSSRRWLTGPFATEWTLSAPLQPDAGVAHPHLQARFAVRALPGGARGRVEVVVENAWAFAAAPANFTYDLSVRVAGTQVTAQAGFVHRAHTRWRKVVYFGDPPAVTVRHDLGYLIDSGALPNYDRTLVVPEATIADLDAAFRADEANPTGVGLAEPYMPQTGGRHDIGLLPRWTLVHLFTGDPRARRFDLGTAERAGSWSIHYRDQATDRPVMIDDFPYMTILGNPGDTVNPGTGQSEAFPACVDCATPYDHDTSHQPSLAFVPYLLTGDRYFLEELQFWANYSLFSSNPYYREFAQGLLHPDQVRGQAWSLRTIGQAAAFSPDDDPLKGYFAAKVANNLAWYHDEYLAAGAPSQNVFGALTTGYAMAYQSGRGLAPWQDDFFTSAVGHLVELGFTDAAPLLAWKAGFPVGRMTDAGFCWIHAASYDLLVRDSDATPFYTSFAQAYEATVDAAVRATACGSQEMATALGLQAGEMTGYSSSPEGYPSNLQPALAMAVDALTPAGDAAWTRFAARTVKPDYATEPNFAILPRTLP